MGKASYPEHINPELQAKDLLKDPIYRFLEQNGVLFRGHFLVFFFGLSLRLLIFIYFGWIPAVASLVAAILVWQIPLMLNVICHLPKFGYKNYAMDDDSVNVWWVGLLALGEGWHNNHHASPGSAKTGMRFWELDFSWLTILLMKYLHIAQRVNVSSHEQLLKNASKPKLIPIYSLPNKAVVNNKFQHKQPVRVKTKV
jgi:stearoyl-CoA desaturase (delta-9 desaturase)